MLLTEGIVMSKPRMVDAAANIPKYWNDSVDMFVMLKTRQTPPTIKSAIPIMTDLTLSFMSCIPILFLRFYPL